MELWEQFALLFTGSDSAYGEWVSERTPKALTKHGKPSELHYKAHLAGVTGLGIVPVNSEGVSYFGAIDIDVDTIDHGALYKNVKERKLPLSVCRSKSGGAHLYFFAGQSGISAVQLQQLLGRWAAILGYPTAEIFPKQKKADAENVGNWINLPYFAGDSTTRYAVGPEGALTLSEFLSSVEYYDPKKQTNEAPVNGAQLPPCLASLQKDGVTAGFRNSALFNYAVFYRKSASDDWEAATLTRNSQFFSPPLDYREVKGILQSASRTKYQYTCDQEPLKSNCNRDLCATLEFGVGHMPWQEKGAFDELTVRACRKLLTNPPRYIVEVNGEDLTLSWDDLFFFLRFRSKVGQDMDLVIAPRKQPSWEQTIRALLSDKTDIEAPDDASMMGMIIEKLHEFLVLRERATQKEDLLRGLPIQDGDVVLFRATDFKRYLQGFKLDKVEGSELFLTLKQHGATHKREKLNGRDLQLWSYPVSKIKEQTEAFAIPDFSKDFEV